MALQSSHALIIGGTGMLEAASRQIVGSSEHATLVARGLAGLQRTAAGASAGLVALDYHDTDRLIARLLAERAAHGAFDLVVLWLHASADDSLTAIVDLLGEQQRPCRIFHVCGSASADPSAETRKSPGSASERIAYHRIILGFVRESARSRWLTHPEICQGVLDALEAEDDDFVVGRVRPWDQRP